MIEYLVLSKRQAFQFFRKPLLILNQNHCFLNCLSNFLTLNLRNNEYAIQALVLLDPTLTRLFGLLKLSRTFQMHLRNRKSHKVPREFHHASNFNTHHKSLFLIWKKVIKIMNEVGFINYESCNLLKRKLGPPP